MCGIAGWVDFDADPGTGRDVLRSMTDTLSCRGPDAEGQWLDGTGALGHRRLSVIDPVGGTQPMVASSDGTRTLAVLSFCGEVYNYRELRTELAARGHAFRTASDTEVLLAGYLEWGAAVAERLNGMFAFAVWDPRSHELLLVRDRLGVKPLYWAATGSGAVFGSEPKALLAHPGVHARVDADGLREVLDMVKTPGQAVFAGMREVRPGWTVTVGPDGPAERRYWSLQAREHPDDLPATIQHVRDLLTDIVDRQLVADVPVCTLLSGGLDSSAVTALAARALAPAPVRSFSVDFTGGEFAPGAVRGEADAPYARDLAAHVGGQHTEVLLDPAELTSDAVRAAVLRATDLPPSYWGDMWPSLYLLFLQIRRSSTVALSGEAADELFGGYLWFRNPGAVQADTFPWLTSGSARYFGGLRLLDPGLLEKLDIPTYRADRYAEAVAEVPSLPDEDPMEARLRRVTHLNLTRFVQTLLDRKDRMSMAVGLEVRVPFCDHRLVEYVYNVPWAMKSFDGREKSLLRAAVADLLPQSVLGRVKTPYPATQDPAYAAALRGRLADLLASDSPALPLLDAAKCRALLDRPLGPVSRPYDRGSLETALWLDAWLRQHSITLEL